MKTFIKFIALVLAVILLGLAGLTIFIKIKFPPEKLKALAAEQAKIYLHREMKLQDVSVGLVNGLVLEGFKLSERPDFSAGAFVSSRRLAVKPFLLPLLHGEVVIKSVELIDPEIHVTRYADGTFNFSDIAGSTAPASTEKSSPVKVFVDHVRINNGAVAFEDKSPSRMNLGVKDLDLSVESFSFLTPFRILLATQLQGSVQGKPLSGHVKFAGSVNLFGGGEAVVKELSVDVLKTSLTAQGSVKNFSSPQADIALKIKSFDPASVAPFVALPAAMSDLQLSGNLDLKGTMTQSSVQGKVSVSASGAKAELALNLSSQGSFDDPHFNAQVGFNNLTIANSHLIPNVTLSGPLDGKLSVHGTLKNMAADVKLDADKASFQYGALASKAAGDAMQVSAHADLKDPFTNPAFQAEGKFAKLTLGSGAPLPADFKMKGPAAVSVSAKGTLDDLALSLNFQGKDVELAYADYFSKPAGTVLDLKLSAGVKDQKLVDLTSCQGTFGPMSFNVHGPLGNVIAEGNMNLSFQAPVFEIAPVAGMVPMIRDYKLSGKTGIAATIRGSFAATQISGTADLKGLGAVPMEGLSFANLSGDVAFTQDSVETNNLKGKFNGSDISLKAKAGHFAAMNLWLDGDLAQLDAAKLMAVFSTPVAPAKPVKKSEAPSLFVGTAYAAETASSPGFLLAKTQGNFRVGIISHPNYLGKNFKMIWDLTNVDAVMNRCNGTAEFTAADGKIHDLPLATKINKLMKRDTSELSYNKMSGHFKVAQGVLDTQDFSVNASYADILAKGRVSLVDLQSTMDVTLKLQKGLGGDVGDWLAGDDGRPTLAVTLKGPISDPAIDKNKTAQKLGEQILKKGLEKFLGNSGGSSSTQPAASGDSAAQNAAPAQQQTSQDQLKQGINNALKGLFKKK